ncbi:MAG: efflux RND transporter periplasmic adaptor subunit [Crocinitomicaceae bacterium]
MNKSFLFITFLSILIGIVSCGEDQQAIHPEKGELTESVYASVEVFPEDMVSVYPARPGILEAIFIDEGDSVFNGQTMASIVSENVKINKENARIGLNLAEEKLKGKDAVLAAMRNEIRIKEEQVLLDSVNFFRQKRLIDKKIGSQMELEQRKMNYDLSRSQLQSLKINYKQTQLELQSTYQQNANAVVSAQNELEDYAVRSVLNGKVYQVFKKEGEFISTQQPLATIGKAEAFILELMVDEVDVAKIRIGQQGLVSLEAYPDTVFEVMVTKIYPYKDEKTQSFKIEAKFVNPPEVLLPGMSGEANIIIQKKKEVLSIPLEYLYDNNKVLTKKGEVEVNTGLRNLERVEILSGLTEDDEILKPKEGE